MFTIPAKIGKNQQKYELVLEILSDDIWIQDNVCKKCKKSINTHNTTENHLNNDNNNSINEYSNSLEQIYLSGKIINEQIAVLNFIIFQNISVADIYLDYINITEDGILGLGYSKSSIVYQLYEKKLISAPVYSLQNTEIDIKNLILDTPDFTSLNLAVISSLTVYYENCTTILSYENITFKEYPLQFSSLSSYITGPIEIIQYFFNDLIWNYQCMYYEEYIICDCYANYPDLVFTIQNKQIYIKSLTI